MVYAFICLKDDRGCGHEFDVVCSMDEISILKPECPECGSFNYTRRNWCNERRFVDAGPKTLGMLADKNASKFSDDYKNDLLSRHDNNPNKKKVK
jgi:hypothetical protein